MLRSVIGRFWTKHFDLLKPAALASKRLSLQGSARNSNIARGVWILDALPNDQCFDCSENTFGTAWRTKESEIQTEVGHRKVR
jgi:hypothetical protein